MTLIKLAEKKDDKGNVYLAGPDGNRVDMDNMGTLCHIDTERAKDDAGNPIKWDDEMIKARFNGRADYFYFSGRKYTILKKDAKAKL